ncbi:hypothetical protein BO221_23020 [Archangium sp. Cb G35]|nr:hypothetical protein BO221_23020 [Archangium sp. Cb G35]
MLSPGGRGGSDFLVRQEREQQLIVGAERAPAGMRRRGEECIAGLVGAFLMGLWGEGNPSAECMGDVEAVCVVEHRRPAIWETRPQFSHELSAHQACDPTTSLCFSHQSFEHLHSRDVVRTEILSQSHQRRGGACLGEGRE